VSVTVTFLSKVSEMGRRPKRATPPGVAEIDGFVVIDKPSGMTSHDVVGQARRSLITRRIGHGGTLDPGATGVLVLGIGRATRLLRYVSDLPKSYEGEIVFGVSTSTLDDEGEVLESYVMGDLTIETVRDAAQSFIGTIEQIPPMVSAIKIDGNRLYDLARQGIEVDRVARTITVTKFELAPSTEPNVVRFAVDCSSGTYVRSLAADLGTVLGGGAHLRRLRRTAIGSFRLEESCKLDELSRVMVQPANGLVRGLDEIRVSDELIEEIAHGKVLDRRLLEVSGAGPWALCSVTGELLAVYEAWTTERIKPSVVLVQPKSAVVSGAPVPEQSGDGR
jgi:tRNA pseudouridine55 synthase